MASGRNFKDIYELEAKFPDEKVKQFTQSLAHLREGFDSIKKAGKSGILSSLRLFTGDKSIQGATNFGDALFRVAGAIQWIGKAINKVSPDIQKLGEDLRSISGIKIEPQIVLAGEDSQKNVAQEAEKATKKAIQAYKRLSTEAVAEIIKVVNAQKTIGDVRGFEALSFAITKLMGDATGLSKSLDDMRSSISATNRELSQSRELGDNQKAAIALILQEQEARDTLRASVEGTIAAYQRENGVLPNIKQARKDLTELLKVEGVDAINAEGLMKRRLTMINTLARAEQQAAAERSAAAQAQKAVNDEVASAAVLRAMNNGVLTANEASKAYRSISQALREYQGTAKDAATIADRLAKSLAQASKAEKSVVGQAAFSRIAEEERLSRELINQLQTTGKINLENSRLPAIIKRVVSLQREHNWTLTEAEKSVRNLLKTEEQLERVGRGRAQRELSTFAELGVLSIVSSRITQSLRTMVSQFGEFEQSLTEVRKTANATSDQMESLGRNLLNISQAIPITAGELARIAGVLGQVGAIDAAGKSIEGFAQAASRAVELVAQISIATDLSAEEAAKSFGQFRAIFTKDVERLKSELTLLTGVTADTIDALRAMFGALNEVANQTVATTGDLNQFIQAFGGVATSAGVAFERIASLGGVVADLGVSLPVAGTAMSRLFQDAIRRADVFAGVVGTSTQEWINLFTVDAEEAIIQFIEGLGRMDVAERTRVLASIAARQRLQQVIVKLADSTIKQSDAQQTLREQLQKTDSLMQNYVSVQEEAEKFSETWNATLNRLSNAVTSLGAAMQPLLKTVAVFLDAIAGLVTRFTTFPVLGPLITSLVGFGVAVVALNLKVRLLSLTYGLVQSSGASLLGMFGRLTASSMTNTSTTQANTAATSQSAAGKTLLATATKTAAAATDINTAALSRMQLVLSRGFTLLTTFSRGLFSVGVAASVAGNALGQQWLSSLGNTIITLQLVIPLVTKLILKLNALATAAATATGAKATVAAAWLGIGTAIKTAAGSVSAWAASVGGAAIATAAATAALAVLSAGLLAFSVAAVVNAQGVHDYIANLIALRATGEATFFQSLLSRLAELRIKIKGGGADLKAFKEEILELSQAARESETAVQQAISPYLKILGFGNRSVQLLSTAIATGAAKTSEVLGKTREEVADLVKENRDFYEAIIRVQDGLKELGKDAQQVAEAFRGFDGTPEGLKKIADSSGLNINLESIIKGFTEAGQRSADLTDEIDKMKKALESSANRADALFAAASRAEGFRVPAPTIDDIERMATVVEDYKTLDDLLEAINRKSDFFSDSFDRVSAGIQSTTSRLGEAEAAQAKLVAELRNEEQLREDIIRTGGGPTIQTDMRITRLKTELELQDSVVVGQRERLAGLKEEESSLRTLLDITEKRIEQDEARLRGSIASKILKEREDQLKAEESLIRGFEESTAQIKISRESSTTQAIYRINQQYYKDLESIRDTSFQDADRLGQAQEHIERIRFENLADLYRNLAEERRKALETELNRSSESIQREQTTLAGNIRRTVEEYSKALESAIAEAERASEESLRAVEQATRGFTAGIFRVLESLEDPLAQFTSGLRSMANEIETLIDLAVTIGNDNSLMQAFELGAEAIRKQAFEAGKALGNLQVRRRLINQEAAQMSRREQNLLIQFRDAFMRTMQDQDLTEVERGRRTSLLRDRAEQLGIGDVANQLADILENERMLEAVLDQAEIQKRMEETAKEQLEALNTLVEQGRVTVAQRPAVTPEKAREEEARINAERARSIQRDADEIVPPEEEQSLEEMLQSLRDNGTQLQENSDRLEEVNEQARLVKEAFSEIPESVHRFNSSVESAATALEGLGLFLSDSEIVSRADGVMDRIRTPMGEAQDNQIDAMRESIEDLGVASSDAEVVAQELLRAHTGALERMVSRMQRIERELSDARRRFTDADVQNARAQTAAATGGEPE